MAALWNSLITVLADTLRFFYGFTGDWGLAIVLLTVAVRVVLLPLTVKQTRSMYEMQALQPKLRELQAKYKNDKEKLQKEMMKFYSEHKVNPFGGCLPLLLQLPIFFALFRMLITVKELQGASTFGIANLTLAPGQLAGKLGADPLMVVPYFLLILVMVVTTYIPQRMITTDPQQQKTMLFMTAFMAFIAWRLPAGVLLYWATTNVWTIAQQYVTLRRGGGIKAVGVTTTEEGPAEGKTLEAKAGGKRARGARTGDAKTGGKTAGGERKRGEKKRSRG